MYVKFSRLLRCQNLNATSVSDSAYPRLQTIERLIAISREHSKLNKDSSAALINIGQAIHLNASDSEMRAFLRGTLFQEVHVRNACLQALQVEHSTYRWIGADFALYSLLTWRIWIGVRNYGSRVMTKMNRRHDLLSIYGRITAWTCRKHFWMIYYRF